MYIRMHYVYSHVFRAELPIWSDVLEEDEACYGLEIERERERVRVRGRERVVVVVVDDGLLLF